MAPVASDNVSRRVWIIAAFDYASMLWALGLGVALFDEAPSPRVLLGAAIVVACGVYVLWREHQSRAIPRRASPGPLAATVR